MNATGPVHGKISTYSRGCRCDECRVARREYTRAYRAKAATRPPPASIHGTAGCYRNWSCRCEPCVEAHKASCRGYYKRSRARGDALAARAATP